MRVVFCFLLMNAHIFSFQLKVYLNTKIIKKEEIFVFKVLHLTQWNFVSRVKVKFEWFLWNFIVHLTFLWPWLGLWSLSTRIPSHPNMNFVLLPRITIKQMLLVFVDCILGRQQLGFSAFQRRPHKKSCFECVTRRMGAVSPSIISTSSLIWHPDTRILRWNARSNGPLNWICNKH